MGVTFLTVFFQSSGATIRSLKIAESYADAAFFVIKILLIHDDYGQFYQRNLRQSSRVGSSDLLFSECPSGKKI